MINIKPQKRLDMSIMRHGILKSQLFHTLVLCCAPQYKMYAWENHDFKNAVSHGMYIYANL